MEPARWIRSIINRFNHWREPEPTEPSPAVLAAARQRVEAATAQIVDAYDKGATTFAVRDYGQDYLITSGHLTTNYYQASRGFNYRGKQLFLVAKDGKIAFAEHVAINPRGSVCTPNGGFVPQQPFHDLSILRLVSPQQTRAILEDMTYNDKTLAALKTVLTKIPYIGNPLADNEFTAEELARLTQNFSLRSIPVERREFPTKQTPSTYSIGQPWGKAEFSRSSVISNQLDVKGIYMALDPNEPVIQGHSGGLHFDVNQNGKITLKGVIAGITGDCKGGFAVPFSEVLRGIDALNAKSPLPKAELARICDAHASSDSWFAGHDVVAGAAHAPAPPVLRAAATQAKVCRRP